MTSLLGCRTSQMAMAPPGTTKVRGLQQVVAAVRGDIVGEVIQGDLAGSRAVLAHDARPGDPGWPVVHDGPVGGSVEVG
jgi:hypothetical protein